jgi:hypothetical protein
MMLGEPIALVAERIRQPRQIERVAQGRRSRRGRGDGRQVEDGKRNQALAARNIRFKRKNVGASACPVNPTRYRPGALTNGPPTAEFGASGVVEVILACRVFAACFCAHSACSAGAAV